MDRFYPAAALLGLLELRGRALGSGTENSITLAVPEAAVWCVLQSLLLPTLVVPQFCVHSLCTRTVLLVICPLLATLVFSSPFSSESGQILKVQKCPHHCPLVNSLPHAHPVLAQSPLTPTFQPPNCLKSLPSLKTDGRMNKSLPTQNLLDSVFLRGCNVPFILCA